MVQGMAEASPLAAEPQAASEHPFEFHGSGGEYFRIWVVNVCLTIVTLGIYSAWAKVRTQQYLAANTRLAGAHFAYLANPIAILKGRALVAGFFLVYAISSFVSVYLESALGIALFFLVPWAVVRSLSFRAHNTAWRNIRFGFRAGYGPAFGAYLGYPMLGALTLGILYPDAIFRQRRFLLAHARYGTTPFAIASRSGDFYRFFGLLLLLFVGMAVTIAIAMGAASAAGGGGYLALGLVAVPFYFLVFGFMASRITNLTYEGAQIGAHRLHSWLPAAGLTGVYLSNAIAILLSFGLLIPWARVRQVRYRLSHLSLVAAGSLDDFVAAQGREIASAGAELGDAFGFDLGL